jgi:hypothetical protein
MRPLSRGKSIKARKQLQAILLLPGTILVVIPTVIVYFACSNGPSPKQNKRQPKRTAF